MLPSKSCHTVKGRQWYTYVHMHLVHEHGFLLKLCVSISVDTALGIYPPLNCRRIEQLELLMYT